MLHHITFDIESDIGFDNDEPPPIYKLPIRVQLEPVSVLETKIDQYTHSYA